ncbi:hypothetical protein D1872_336040 [compost metagenome]
MPNTRAKAASLGRLSTVTLTHAALPAGTSGVEMLTVGSGLPPSLAVNMSVFGAVTVKPGV